MRRSITVVFAIAAAIALPACSSTPAAEDPPPVAPAPAPSEPEPEPTQEPPPPRVEKQPVPEPEAKTSVRYSGRVVVAALVEREQIRCTGADAQATLQQNRRGCAQQLMSQLKEPDSVVVVIDEQPGVGCATCVSMLAEVSPIVGEPPGQVLFISETAGTVECNAGEEKLTLEQTRSQCLQTLQREAASLRAGVVLPMGIVEGQPCKSCISIIATGYTATVLP